MSLFKKRVADLAQTQIALYGRSATNSSMPAVSADSAMRSSAVWACLRLRADLISTLPVDVYRRVQGVQVEVPKPKLLVDPGGSKVSITEWMYSTQIDLDRYGNTFGLITERDGQNLPSRIDLLPAGEVTVRAKGSDITEFRYGGRSYTPPEVWHEKQFTVAGLPVGLSPIAYAAWSIGGYLSAQEFALGWFTNGGHPTGHLQNTKTVLDPAQAKAAKDRFKDAVRDGDVFVSGNDWTYTVGQVSAAGGQFLAAMKASVSDTCRFFGVPGDMVDAETTSGSITYANVTQRNLQLLVINLNPAIIRREGALSRALPAPRYVKLNTDALLRMDPTARVALINSQVTARTLAPSEARELDNRQPFTDEQLAEFDRLFGSRTQSPAKETSA